MIKQQDFFLLKVCNSLEILRLSKNLILELMVFIPFQVYQLKELPLVNLFINHLYINFQFQLILSNILKDYGFKLNISFRNCFVGEILLKSNNLFYCKECPKGTYSFDVPSIGTFFQFYLIQ